MRGAAAGGRECFFAAGGDLMGILTHWAASAQGG